MPPNYFFSDTESIPWRDSTVAEGVKVKDLGTANGRSMQLVRFEPGTRFPSHIHAGPEFIYIIDGEAIQNGQQLGPGWASVAEAGTSDNEFHSPNGCTFLTVYSE